jgi:hypothetical protein
VVAGASGLAVSDVVPGEYRPGIAQSCHRLDFENWPREWVAAVTVLAVDQETPSQYAAVGLERKRSGKAIPSMISGLRRSAVSMPRLLSAASIGC